MTERILFNAIGVGTSNWKITMGHRFYICTKSWKHLNYIRQRAAAICARQGVEYEKKISFP